MTLLNKGTEKYAALFFENCGNFGLSNYDLKRNHRSSNAKELKN